MALPDLRGKTKKDLAAIAHISGLLRPSDTSRMTKQQLLDYLLSVAEDAKDAETISDVASETAEIKQEPDKAAVKKTKKNADKAEAASDESNVSESKEEKPSEKETASKKTKTTTRKTRTIKAKKAEEDEGKKTGAKTVREVKKTTSKKKADGSESAEEEDADAVEKETAADDVPATEVKHRELVAVESEDDNGEENGEEEEKQQEIATGVLEVMPEGYGFLRVENYIQSSRDIYVPPQYIRRFNLRTGDLVTSPCVNSATMIAIRRFSMCAKSTAKRRTR